MPLGRTTIAPQPSSQATARAALALCVLISFSAVSGVALAVETRVADQEFLPPPPGGAANLGGHIAIAAELGEAMASAYGIRSVFRYGWDDATRSWIALDQTSWDGPAQAVGVASGGDHFLYTRTLDGDTTSIRRQALAADQLVLAGIPFLTSAVATDGDFLAIGQPFVNSNAGRVLIYARVGGTWQVDEIFLGAPGARLGASLAMDGPVLVAGAPHHGPHGAVFVYARTSFWFELQRLDCPASVGTGAQFGLSVALAGDNLVVGAPFLDRLVPGGANISRVGGVYTYDVSIAFFTLESLVRPAGAMANDNFGAGVALWRLPGHALVLAAGAPGEDAAGEFRGAAHVFHHHGSRWSEELRLVDGTPMAFDQVGSGIAVGPMGVLAGATGNGDLGVLSNGAVLAWNGVVPLFYDGFESGDTSGWDVVVP